MSAPAESASGACREPGAGRPPLRGIKLGTVSQTLGPLASLIILSLLIWSQEDVFMTSDNWLNIARQASFNAILGIGMTFVILTGGVDLSVGSMVAVSSVVGGLLIFDHGWSMWPAVLAMILAGGALRAGQRADHHARPDPALHRHPGHDADLSRRRPPTDQRQTDLRHHQGDPEFRYLGHPQLRRHSLPGHHHRRRLPDRLS